MQLKADCLSALSVVHSLKFMHRDIKSENIGWSQQRNKFVFLDFGFAGFIQEEVGSATVTRFIGTFGYVCEEMEKLYFLGRSGQIDMYYNDLFGV